MVSNQSRITEIDNDVSVLEGNVLKQTREKDALSNRAVKEEENLRENEDSQKQMDQNIRELSRKIQDFERLGFNLLRYLAQTDRASRRAFRTHA